MPTTEAEAAQTLSVHSADPADEDARGLLVALSHALLHLTGDGGTSSFADDDVRVDGAAFVVARDASGRACGCGALRPQADGVAEIKRMYAAPGTRGVGAALLLGLETRARACGYRAIVLSTRIVNERAVAFYHRHGYAEVAPWGKYIDNPRSICLGKTLAAV
ncbi:GNAT family N-acetyltransferase [Solimonas marina]|uniref:GNAT family N-acetyltransferase n=1 Tax=Solimonas marina TaxID=2714601 RepID=A0A970B6Y4_9GAMM|nr:GNAT family N-acetyltransferase [Solimonas marina]NKF23090.1 GNAT family N-acetyltransferase [Solimonas marina]